MIANHRVFQVGFDIPANIGDHINDIHTPALVINLDAFERNVSRMADRVRAMGVRLRAHAKTHKSLILHYIKSETHTRIDPSFPKVLPAASFRHWPLE
jgi:hypothetical protein